jgi:hypothetical protein
MGSQTQQREMWIYLAITWWIGSLAAWLIAWFSTPASQSNESMLTATALLVFGVSACLRLPVLTVQTPTTSLEDHFVWLLAATANVNWLGYLSINIDSIPAVIPAILIGVAIEWWLWNQAGRADCLVWARRIFPILVLNKPGKPSATASSTALVNATHPEIAKSTSAEHSTTQAGGQPVLSSMGNPESCLDRNVVQRTLEDGIDPTGRRYLAGEVKLDWLADQRTQTIVIGFVPAFIGNPEVEYEVNCDLCTAQIINCTPAGLRIQLRRNDASSELVTNMSWYARQAESTESRNALPGSISLN